MPTPPPDPADLLAALARQLAAAVDAQTAALAYTYSAEGRARAIGIGEGLALAAELVGRVSRWAELPAPSAVELRPLAELAAAIGLDLNPAEAGAEMRARYVASELANWRAADPLAADDDPLVALARGAQRLAELRRRRLRAARDEVERLAERADERAEDADGLSPLDRLAVRASAEAAAAAHRAYIRGLAEGARLAGLALD